MLHYVILSSMVVLCGALPLEPATSNSVSDLAAIMQAISLLDSHLQTQINNLTDQITKDRRQVAFFGTVGVKIPASDSDQFVKYQHVTTNIGNAYSSNTGVFTCPVSGLYLFSSQLVSEPGRSIAINMYQNGNIIARPYTGASGSAGETSSTSDTAVVHANAGDEMYLTDFFGSSTYLDNMSNFVAVLLKAD